MQGGGTVAVQRGFGVARGAAGVTHAGRCVFVKHRPLIRGALVAHPSFIAGEVGDARVCG